MSPGPVADQWHSRDFPVLVEIARRTAAGDGPVDTGPVAESLGLEHDQVLDACVALTPTYLDGRAHMSGGGQVYVCQIRGLTRAAAR